MVTGVQRCKKKTEICQSAGSPIFVGCDINMKVQAAKITFLLPPALVEHHSRNETLTGGTKNPRNFVVHPRQKATKIKNIREHKDNSNSLS